MPRPLVSPPGKNRFDALLTGALLLSATAMGVLAACKNTTSGAQSSELPDNAVATVPVSTGTGSTTPSLPTITIPATYIPIPGSSGRVMVPGTTLHVPSGAVTVSGTRVTVAPTYINVPATTIAVPGTGTRVKVPATRIPVPGTVLHG